MPPRPSRPNQFAGSCRLCHQSVAPDAGRAVKTGKGWRILCAACAADPGSAAVRGARGGWVFALAMPGEEGRVFVGCSRFPALRCAQWVTECVLAARQPGNGGPLRGHCEAWAIEVPDRFLAREALRRGLTGQDGAGGTYRASLDEALTAARAAGLTGKAVPVRPTADEWRKSGQ